MTERKHETLCYSCNQLVGVWSSSWNRTLSGASPTRPALPKTSRHQDATGRICPGSMLTINPMSIMAESA